MSKKYEACFIVPFGTVAIVSGNHQARIDLFAEELLVAIEPVTQPLTAKLYRQLMSYFALPSFKCDFPLLLGTPFQLRVWRAIYDIPFGETRTYGQLATLLGSGARAVANACGANPLPIIIPCHRVVAKSGIGGFMQGKKNGLLVKHWLLRYEGVDLGVDYA
jgi:methylated-DNA-[protein]-cysteine S-methyltransferase